MFCEMVIFLGYEIGDQIQDPERKCLCVTSCSYAFEKGMDSNHLPAATGKY